VASAVKKIASQKSLSLKSDEDVIHIAWDNYNGANKIGAVDEESIVVSIAKRQDMGLALRRPSAGKVSRTWGIMLGGGCGLSAFSCGASKEGRIASFLYFTSICEV